MQINPNKIRKILRRVYRGCPGRTMHEKIVHAPEALLRESGRVRILDDQIRKAKVIADWVSRTQHRYVLDDAVAGAAVAIADLRGESLGKVLPHVRIPHPRLWLEFSDAGRWDMAAVADTFLKNGQAFLPRHFGMMIESDDIGRRGTVEFCLLDPREGIVLYPIGFHFDFDDPRLNEKAGAVPGGVTLPFVFPRHIPNAAGNPTRSWLEYAAAQQGSAIRGQQTILESCRIYNGPKKSLVDDVVSEFRFMISALGMMALRNGVKAEASALPRPPAAAGAPSLQRRLDAQDLTAPTMIRMTMALSHDPDRDRARGRRSANAPGRHWVAGHFKVRKTGVFWWSPHVRGDAARDLTETPRDIRVIRPPEAEEVFAFDL
jgi:hypothetical protein